MSTDWVVCTLDLELEAVSGVRVGATAAPTVQAGTDLPVLRTPSGDPLVPGSSFKGVLRSAAERLLRGRGLRACDPLQDPCLGDRRDISPTDLEQGLCWTCQLFGSRHKASRVWVGDLVAVGGRTFVRDGVAIDRGELKAAEGLKYDYEVVAPGTVFRGQLRIDDPEDGDLGLLLSLLDLLDAGMVTVGGGASRGLGRVRLRRPPAVTVLRASTFRPGSLGEQADLERERAAFETRLSALAGEVGP